MLYGPFAQEGEKFLLKEQNMFCAYHSGHYTFEMSQAGGKLDSVLCPWCLEPIEIHLAEAATLPDELREDPVSLQPRPVQHTETTGTGREQPKGLRGRATEAHG